ncbi:hypothetical protein EUX98_g8187 [Antrodiella citrinella]|uniref:Cytochrome P450 n=1 Tax=Antrodiella citrinella TaxID=2447956 RepID=A0A4S4MCA7_9APHY|nr:hypothetical protein EUX98_g8187 [Antrodiella citrinella]
MTSEILCGDSFFPFLRYGDRYRKFRKLGHEGLNPRASEQYTPFQERESRILIQDLLTDSTKWSAHISRAIASSTLALSYAVPPIKSYDDIIVTRINDFMHRVEQSARPGEYIVDIFPILNYLPESLAPFKKNGLKAFTEDSKLFSGLFKDARAREGSTCFTTLLAPKVDSGAVGENEASWLAGSMFGAGSSTTAGAQHVLILAMVLHPHVMYKAQAEIDAVVGRHRLPNAGDRDKLPYLRAITREAFRWRPIGPLGVPHYVNQDDEYQGYHLPKDSIVFFNQWAMCSDIEVYGDPENFRPERFLDETETEENLPINTHGEGHTSFGYGRRKCLGQSVANNTLMINLATMLWAFDIVKAKDANGNEITPDKDNMHDEGLVVVPAPFLCDFIPRDPEHLPEIIAQAFDAAH